MLMFLLVLMNLCQLCIELYREYKALKREIRGQIARESVIRRINLNRMNEQFDE